MPFPLFFSLFLQNIRDFGKNQGKKLH